jgi:hypothetical protein
VEEVGAADRSDLAIAEKAGGRNRTDAVGHCFGVMMRSAEEIFATAVAAEEE